jgi:hypothetical protein
VILKIQYPRGNPTISFTDPLDIYGANILTPRKQHLSGVIPFYPYAIPLYLWGEHFQKLLNSLLSFVIHDISLCGNEKTLCADEKSECVDIKAGYPWICKDIEGYLMDMQQDIVWI